MAIPGMVTPAPSTQMNGRQVAVGAGVRVWMCVCVVCCCGVEKSRNALFWATLYYLTANESSRILHGPRPSTLFLSLFVSLSLSFVYI
jgi:hypothetical protein